MPFQQRIWSWPLPLAPFTLYFDGPFQEMDQLVVSLSLENKSEMKSTYQNTVNTHCLDVYVLRQNLKRAQDIQKRKNFIQVRHKGTVIQDPLGNVSL